MPEAAATKSSTTKQAQSKPQRNAQLHPRRQASSSDHHIMALHRSAGNNAVASLMEPKANKAALPPVVAGALQSPSQTLDPDTRAFMDSRFGRDFGQVRLHTDAGAANSASTINANAYTIGNDIVFGHGFYRPHTPGGRAVLAHELAHVVQQSEGYGPTPSTTPSGTTEVDADGAASRVLKGEPAAVQARSATGIARQAAGGQPAIAIGGATDKEKLTNALAILDSIKQVGSNQFQVTLNGKLLYLTQADVNSAFQRTRSGLRSSISSIKIKAEGAIDGYNEQAKVDDEHPVVSRVVKFFGDIDDPGDLIRAKVFWSLQNLTMAQAALESHHFVMAGNYVAEAEKNAKQAQRLYQNYHEAIISTGEATITVLEYTRDASFVTLAVLATIATAGAAAGATSIAGVEIGAVSTVNTIAMGAPLVAKFGEAGVKLAYGDPVDWGQLAIDTAITIVASKFGGKLSSSIAGRIIGQNPAVASLGRHVVGGIVGGVVAGRGTTFLGTAVNATYAKLRGKNVTWEGFLDQVAAEMTDPKSLTLDVMLSAVGAYGAGKGAKLPSTNAPHEAPSAAKPSERKPATTESKAGAAAPSKPKQVASESKAAAAPKELPQAEAEPSPAVAAKEPAKPAPKGTPAPPESRAAIPPAREKAAAPAAKGPVIEETRIKPTVIRRRRGPAAPGGPKAEKRAPAAEEPLSRKEQKAQFVAEAKEEIEAFGRHGNEEPGGSQRENRQSSAEGRIPKVPRRPLDLPEYQESIEAARRAMTGLPAAPGVKTTAGVEGGDPTRSGYKPTKQFPHAEEATERAVAEGRQAGAEPEAHEFDRSAKAGGSGQVRGSHAEKQAAVLSPDAPVGVSKAMCSDCQAWFRNRAVERSVPQFVADPNGTRVFMPDGTVHFAGHPEGMLGPRTGGRQ